MARLELELIAPSELVPWKDNPRINDHAVEAVVSSINRFGFAAPLVARPSDKRLLAGHTRLKAAIQVGLKMVPVRWLELNDTEAAAFTLADNRLGEKATWDDDALADILDSIEEADADVEGLGWSGSDLDELLGELEGDDETKPKSKPKKKAAARKDDKGLGADVVAGQTWRLGGVKDSQVVTIEASPAVAMRILTKRPEKARLRVKAASVMKKKAKKKAAGKKKGKPKK